MATYGRRASRIIAPAGGLTVLFGLILGLVLGAFQDIGRPLGNTYLAALVIGVGLLVFGMLVVGKTAERLSTLAPGSEPSRAPTR